MVSKLLFLWQLPQNIIGSILTRKNCQRLYIQRRPVYYKKNFHGLILCLGDYVVMDTNAYGSTRNVSQAYRNKKLSRVLGPLYLFVLPFRVRRVKES